MAYLKNRTDNFFQIFFMWTSWVAVSINNIKTRASSEMTSRKNIKIFYCNVVNVAKHWHVAGRGICHLWLPCLELQYIYRKLPITRMEIEHFWINEIALFIKCRLSSSCEILDLPAWSCISNNNPPYDFILNFSLNAHVQLDYFIDMIEPGFPQYLTQLQHVLWKGNLKDCPWFSYISSVILFNIFIHYFIYELQYLLVYLLIKFTFSLRMLYNGIFWLLT